MSDLWYYESDAVIFDFFSKMIIGYELYFMCWGKWDTAALYTIMIIQYIFIFLRSAHLNNAASTSAV